MNVLGGQTYLRMHKTYLLHYRDPKKWQHNYDILLFILWISFKFSTCDVLNPSRLSFNEVSEQSL